MYLTDHYWRLNSCYDPDQAELNQTLSEVHSVNLRIRELRGTFTFGQGRKVRPNSNDKSFSSSDCREEENRKETTQNIDADATLLEDGEKQIDALESTISPLLAEVNEISHKRSSTTATVAAKPRIPTVEHDRLKAEYERGLAERKLRRLEFFDPESSVDEESMWSGRPDHVVAQLREPTAEFSVCDPPTLLGRGREIGVVPEILPENMPPPKPEAGDDDAEAGPSRLQRLLLARDPKKEKIRSSDETVLVDDLLETVLAWRTEVELAGESCEEEEEEDTGGSSGGGGGSESDVDADAAAAAERKARLRENPDLELRSRLQDRVRVWTSNRGLLAEEDLTHSLGY